jgi:hypothetical protein
LLVDNAEKGDSKAYTFEKSVEFNHPLNCPDEEYTAVAFLLGG